MKKLLLLIFLIPLFGVTPVEETQVKKTIVYKKRPTLDQCEQLKENELGVLNSRIKVGIAELKNN